MRVIALVCIALALGLLAVLWRQDRGAPVHPGPSTLLVDANTRLLVIAPHPDDEVIAAGGVIQQVRANDGVVHIVYLTDGEGYPEGVRAEHRSKKNLTPADYRAYGHQRELEAREAVRELGSGAWSLTFLGFPNGGLHRLRASFWSPRRGAYRSRFTHLNRPAPSESFIPDTEYRGEDLNEELAEILSEFKPTLVLVPRPEDQHVDHCAAWFFVADAIGDVQRVHPTFHADLVNYIVHYYSWPFDSLEASLPPPEDLDDGVSGWLIVPLSDRQVDTKRAALHKYKSQMDVMGWFLDGFARTNEVFSRPAPPNIVLPVSTNVCDEFIER